MYTTYSHPSLYPSIVPSLYIEKRMYLCRARIWAALMSVVRGTSRLLLLNKRDHRSLSGLALLLYALFYGSNETSWWGRNSFPFLYIIYIIALQCMYASWWLYDGEICVYPHREQKALKWNCTEKFIGTIITPRASFCFYFGSDACEHCISVNITFDMRNVFCVRDVVSLEKASYIA